MEVARSSSNSAGRRRCRAGAVSPSGARAGRSRAVTGIRRAWVVEDLQRDHAVGQCSLVGLSGVFCGMDRKGLCRRHRLGRGCAAYGWHVPGRSRVPLLHSQHDRALGPAAAAAKPSAPSSYLVPTVAAAPAVASVLVRPAPVLQPRLKWGACRKCRRLARTSSVSMPRSPRISRTRFRISPVATAWATRKFTAPIRHRCVAAR